MPAAIFSMPRGQVLRAVALTAAISILGGFGHGRALGREQDTLKGLVGPLGSMALAPDGKTLAAAGGRGLMAWDTQTGRVKWTHEPDAMAMGFPGGYLLDFSPDGKTLACVRSGAGFPEKLLKVPGAGGGMRPGVLPAGSAIELRDAQTGRVKRAFRCEHAENARVAFSPDGKTLAVPGYDVQAVRLLDGGMAISGSKTKITLCDTQTGRVRSVLRPDGQTDFLGIRGVAFSPDGKTLASVGGYGIVLWDVPAAKLKATLGQGSYYGVAFRPDGKKLAVSFNEGNQLAAMVCDLETGKGTATLQKRYIAKFVTATAFSRDVRTLASAEGLSTIALWDVETGEQRAEIQTGRLGSVVSLAFSADGKTLASGSSDGTIRLWDVDRLPAGKNAEAKPPPKTGPLSESRVWTSADGNFTVEAELVNRLNGTVILRKKNGVEITVPLGKLSGKDQELLRNMAHPQTDADGRKPGSAMSNLLGRLVPTNLTPKVLTYRIAPFQGKLSIDLTVVEFLFEGIPDTGGIATGQLTVSGPGVSQGEYRGGRGTNQVTVSRSYSNGIARVTVKAGKQRHTLEFRGGATELVINDKQTFELGTKKKSIIIGADGVARIAKR